MKLLFTKAQWLFLLLLCVIALPLFWRIFWLRQVYFDSVIRAQVQSAISAVAEKEGWLLSDISLLAVDVIDGERVMIMHRNHIRGGDPLLCQTIQLKDLTLQSCHE